MLDTKQISPVVIIGTGLIGASLGCALTSAGVHVALRDKKRSHALVGASRGAGVLEQPANDQVKLVVVATPPEVISKVVAASLAKYPNAIVTDVGSIKGKIARELAALNIDLSRYIGSHPMAGSHHAGPITAASELFVDRTWVITPRPDHSAEVVQTLITMIEATRARIVELDADTHDRAVAEVSHVPQLISSLTAARLAEVPASDLKLAGQGLRDMTRIAASDVELWRQIVGGNREPIKAQLTALRADLDRLINTLDQDQTVVDVLERGNIGVAAIPSRRGKRAGELVAIVVEIPDEPGALTRLFNDITTTGINIEDLSIEHDPHRDVGYLSVDVALDRADGLREKMRELGWGLRVGAGEN